jgi:copper chaperone NosL
MTLRLFLLAAVLAAGCSANAGGPPAIQVDRTACAHCTMLVSDERFAAAYETAAGDQRVFDDIACLLEAVRGEPATAALTFWFHDVPSGAWIRGHDATFVKAPSIRTPMSGGIVAYRDSQEAARVAQAAQGKVLPSLRALLAPVETGK